MKGVGTLQQGMQWGRRLISRLIKGRRKRKSALEKSVDHLKLLTAYRHAGMARAGKVDYASMKVCWVIPDFIPGAGGHMTIFRIASYLERFGHEVRFLIQNPMHHKTGEAARETINRHFQPFKGSVGLFKGTTPDCSGDALIATDRFTCYPVNAMQGYRRRFYFVQDFEPAFYPAGTEALLSEATYGFDFDCLCAGDWLHKRMSTEFGRWSMSWPLAYEKDVYRVSDPPKPRHKARIALYARYVTPRRAVELGVIALEILRKRGHDFEVDFFGWEIGEINLPFKYRDLGVLSAGELAKLYQESTLGVVFSATNHSLVNKEMMACGLPVIDLDVDSVRSIFPQDTMGFARPTPEGIADAVEHLLNDSAARQRLSDAALRYVVDFSWERSARLVEAALKERVRFAEMRGS